MISLVDSIRPQELTGDLATRARKLGGRHAVRLLHSVTIPAFVSAIELIERSEPKQREDLALFVVSGWEPGIPSEAGHHDGTLESRETQARLYQESVNPLRWLSGMPNAILCQVAITAGVRGPNLHWVGDGATLCDALMFIDQILAVGAAPAAAIVVYDPPEGERFAAPDSVRGSAAALMVVHDPEAGFEVVDAGAAAGMRAVDLADEVVLLMRAGGDDACTKTGAIRRGRRFQ